MIMAIRYIGLKDLDQNEQAILTSIIEKEQPKITRLLKNEAELIVKIKVVKKESRKRFMISLQLNAPTRPFIVKNRETEKGGDWDIAKAAHKELNALKYEINHRLKADSPEWKRSGIKRFVRELRL